MKLHLKANLDFKVVVPATVLPEWERSVKLLEKNSTLLHWDVFTGESRESVK